MHAINTAQTNTSHRWRWQLHVQICVLCDDWFTGASLGVRAKTLEYMETIAPQIIGHIRGRSGAMCKCVASERNEQTSISSVQWKSAIYVCMYRFFLWYVQACIYIKP